jgi:hypothetical protein
MIGHRTLVHAQFVCRRHAQVHCAEHAHINGRPTFRGLRPVHESLAQDGDRPPPNSRGEPRSCRTLDGQALLTNPLTERVAAPAALATISRDAFGELQDRITYQFVAERLTEVMFVRPTPVLARRCQRLY